MITEVVVRFRFEGVHFWPGAIDHPEVAFLSYPHRHEFHVEARKMVSHPDRDIEIIMLKRELKGYVAEWSRGGLGTLSCEQIAEELVKRYGLSYCEVLEDGENGACVSA